MDEIRSADGGLGGVRAQSCRGGESNPPRVSIAVLGGLTVTAGGQVVPSGPTRQQICLALLACSPNTIVPASALVEAIWDEDPPRTAHKNLQVYVAGVRRTLGDRFGGGRLRHVMRGYRLDVAPDELDLLQFEFLVAQGRRAMSSDGPAAGADLLDQALFLWRGAPAAHLHFVPEIRRRAERMAERYVSTVESWAEARLAAGDLDQVAERLAEVAQDHPLRERVALLRMRVLAEAGCTGDALGVYSELRRELSGELGLAPGPEVERAHRSLLDGSARTRPRQPAIARPGGPVRLPPALPGALSRRRDVEAVVALLAGRPGARAAIHGPVGSGRTTVAVEAAHRLAARFPDGCLWLSLDSRDPADPVLYRALTELLRQGSDAESPAAGQTPGSVLQQRPGASSGQSPVAAPRTGPGSVPGEPDLHELRRNWQSWVADRQLLLVLDDVPDHATAMALIPERGASAALVTSVTSLSGLPSTRQVKLSALDPADAVALLSAASGRDFAATDLPAARRIVGLAGRWPLGLCRAGAKLGQQFFLSVEQFADRLERSQFLIQELDTRDGELAARLGTALAATTPEHLSALSRICDSCDGAFSPQEVVDALAGTADDAYSALDALLETGLVWPEDEEVTLHRLRLEVPSLVRAATRAYYHQDCNLVSPARNSPDRLIG